ncbi:MAG: YqaE/Pmp3 family membrane protein [Gloeocapsa sp. DLM2.Bin57]|nr:MAG: YqaE/Pmp3 family membrane protein [Gloeocapsa sp. DLM2.Bin57]
MSDVIKVICTILLPPLGVFLQVGLGKDFWINLLLTIVGLYIAGLVHGIWVIARKSN